MLFVRAALLVFASAAIAACNPNPRGQCDSSADCTEPGAVCNLQDGLCEAAASICNPACNADAGFVCKSNVCTMQGQPGQPSVQLLVAQNALFSPSMNQVGVSISADSSVVLGQLSLSVSELDGGLFDGGLLASALIAAASADAGVTLIFAPGAQAPGNLVASLSYSSADAGGTVSSATVPVRIDAVPPSVSFNIQSAHDEVSGWFPRTLDGGIAVNATINDTSSGSGPDGGTLTILGCGDGGGCVFSGTPIGFADAGARTYRFAFPRTLAPAGAQGPLSFTIDGFDNAGNQTDESGVVLIDNEAPITDAQITIVNTDAGTIGEDGQLWFPAGTLGVDVEVDLAAVDDGVGLDPASFLLTFAAGDIDTGQSATVNGYLPGDGKVHFKVPTGRTSKREGPLAFTITMADKLGNAAAPVQGQILIDDAPPVVSLASADYTDATISPLRSAVCASTATCGRGPASAPDHALRDDVVTTNFTAVDCGVGLDLGALPSCALFLDPSQGNFNFSVSAVATGTATPGNCANGSTNPKHGYTCQFSLATDAPVVPETASGQAPVFIAQVAFDSIGGEGQSPTPNPGGGPGAIEVSRWRWKAPLGGHPTGAAALLPLADGVTAASARELVVPVDGTAAPASPDGLELFDGTGSISSLQLGSNGSFDNATGDVAVGASRTIWISGTPFACNGGLSTCTNLWAARASAGAAACSTPEPGVIDSLAVRDAADGGIEVAVVGLEDGGLSALGEIAGSFSAGGSATSVSCAHVSQTARTDVAAATGVSLAQGRIFVASEQGFYSVALDKNGQFSGFSAQEPFIAGSTDALVALPAAPSVQVEPDGGSPFFAAEDSLSSPTIWGLREAAETNNIVGVGSGGGSGGAGSAGSSGGGPPGACNGDCWVPADAPWSDVATTARVLHSPVFDSNGIYSVDSSGNLQLSEFGTESSVATSSAPAVSLSGAAQAQLVSPPVLLEGGSAGSGALVVQSNGLVRLHALGAASTAAAAPSISPVSVLTVGAFSSAQPPPPVLDVRGAGSVAYVVDGSGTCAAGGTSCSWVWALQLDAAPVAASMSVWPRPQHDSCNSREAEGTCP